VANRRISELPAISAVDIQDADLFTIVHVSEVDPGLKNKQFTVSQHKSYLNGYYLQITGGTIANNLTVGNNLNVSGSVTVAQNLNVSGSGTFGTLVIDDFTSTGTISGVTITGTSILGVTVNGNNGFFNSLQSPAAAMGALTATTISGGAITGDTIAASGITGQTISGNTVLGVNVSGVTVQGASGIFVLVSGSTVTGDIGRFTNLTGVSGTFTSSLSGATITGNIGQFANLTGVSGTFTDRLSGAVITGVTGQFTQLNAVTGQFTTASGDRVTGTTGAFTTITGQNIYAGNLISGNVASVISGIFIDLVAISGQFLDRLSGAVITGQTGLFNSLTVGGINITGSVSGGTITGTSGQFVTLTAQTGIFTDTISIPSITTTGNLSASGDLIVKGSGYITSGLVVSGTISGNTITGQTFIFDTATGSSLNATGLISGVLITGNTIQTTTLTGTTGIFTSLLSGATITGTSVQAITGQFTSGIFTTISGGTITGSTAQFVNLTGVSGTFTSRVSGAIVTGNTGLFTVISGVSGQFTNLSGATITGNTINAGTGTFILLNATTVNFTSTATGNIVASGSGIFGSGLLTSGSLFVSGSGIFGSGILASSVSGATVTGNSGQFTTVTAVTGIFTTSVSGTVVSGGVGSFTTISGNQAFFNTSVSIPSGSAAAPSISFNDDSNTGIFSSGADQLAIATNSTVRLTTSNSAISSALPINVPLASASTPSLTFTGDLNTGIYSPGADQLAISTGGSGKLYIDSAGVITTDNGFASGRLNVVNTNTVATFDRMLFLRSNNLSNAYLGLGSDSFYVASASNAPIVFCTNSDGGTSGSSIPTNERLRITSAGLVGIGTSAPGYPLDVNGAARSTGTSAIFVLSDRSTGIGDRYGIYSNANTFRVYDFTAAADRVVVDSAGNVGIGVTSPTYLCNVIAAAGSQNIFQAGQTGVSNGYTITSNGTNLTHAWFNGGSEAARIDSSGRLLVGTSTALTTFFGTAVDKLAIAGGAGPQVIGCYAANEFGARFDFVKSRSATVNGQTVVLNDDTLGEFYFGGSDGTAPIPSARIHCAVDGTPGANDMPGRLIFSTTADGAASPTERLRITSAGLVGIGASAPDAQLKVAAAGATLFIGFDGNKNIFDASDNIFRSHAGSERARIDSSGRLLVGTSTALAAVTGVNPALQVQGTGEDAYASIARWAANSANPGLIFNKSRGASVGTRGVVAANDRMGEVAFGGDDGTSFIIGATIVCDVDGTPGTNDMPGRLMFSTTADGASSPTERMRIKQGGSIKISNSGAYHDVNTEFHEIRQTTNQPGVVITSADASFTNNTIHASSTRAADSAFSLVKLETSVFSDVEFNLRGDGNAFADGTWTAGGADYAEYFEWFDSNPGEEDRRGISVVLDGDKIREAQVGEDPIGVISGNPSIVGDAAWNKWNGKYLRDEFGTYIQEDYEVEDEDGNTVIQQRRKLNPAYDPDVEYVSRENRPEWDCVGLMGKLRISKGQVTGSRWIKMRDINDSVEEWLVR
jgi:hypothetical protein